LTPVTCKTPAVGQLNLSGQPDDQQNFAAETNEDEYLIGQRFNVE
jgi:hypothetical protein